VTDDKDKKDAQTFAFDRVYDGNSKQNDVFEYIAAPMVKEVLEGYNATVFAYGQTGAGKTYTMQGSDLMDSDHAGIIPRTAKAMFQEIQKDTASSVEVKASFVEIYMEKIRDLLDDTGHKSNLQVREDILRGIYIADVIEFKASSGEDLLDIMARGSKNRAVAATGMNEGSSRSHSVFTINIVKTDKATNIAKSGKLVLVDLAGSETNKKTGTTGQQLKEATMINKSLSALGNVINALTEVSSKAVHIPYRDSKLTRVLQDSLG
jgi:kinesin family protein 5